MNDALSMNQTATAASIEQIDNSLKLVYRDIERQAELGRFSTKQTYRLSQRQVAHLKQRKGYHLIDIVTGVYVITW